MKLTPKQRTMARHALGLHARQDRAVSHRNYYAAGAGTSFEAAWQEMVRGGYAEPQRVQRGPLVGFSLTQEGAEAVLQDGERLDPEDFPNSERKRCSTWKR